MPRTSRSLSTSKDKQRFVKVTLECSNRVSAEQKLGKKRHNIIKTNEQNLFFPTWKGVLQECNYSESKTT